MQIVPTPLKDLAALLDCEFVGAANHQVTGFNEIHRVKKGDCLFVDHPKYYEKALGSAGTTIIIDKAVDCPVGKALLIHPQPFTAFNQLTKHFNPPSYPTQAISETARIGKNTVLMPGCSIGNNVTIGNDCVIYPNVIIYSGCTIGNRVTIHANTTIGSDAFYFKKRDSSFEPLYTCGTVVIEDDVVIGANCAIDKGVTDETRIGRASILDNHIHIGHDVLIGEQCLFAAQVGIAGVCTIGNRVTIWGQAGISSDVVIEDGATILAQSGVGEHVAAGRTFFGTPAGDAREKMREIFATKQLPSLMHAIYKNK
jgi:UDP-3-O-[3-hydroxymyristoyl] glucosamine N-acyltransferase